MKTREAYNIWATQYDTNKNKTRDLEARALRQELSPIPFVNCLEIGCGTGKNTVWLIQKAAQVTAVDLSEEMLARAKEKVSVSNVTFMQADITAEWPFETESFDLVSFSLVLEHIADLNFIFAQVAKVLKPGGHVYLGELHPFKQYAGTKARFDTEAGRTELECFTHHISEFMQAARNHQLRLLNLNEYFDENDPTKLPRILTLVLQKSV
ncbi:class I SAM-dependent methyltransferase [Adhaeribacter rhizoryzae]|uniref:Class I SAM-dependent methyltransferase n=1 Tax=Adhaeribacter rhizoryzae TaxID=2607907 RepID=A0A5M6CZR6_9BACT|nr:class I SAM-dependent methyltransferase [Adhaeribacter rhizoryzae]KAA5540583.1 class I SAM-dependent methyltransferase [Adhaeribacter rhizoryzae]